MRETKSKTGRWSLLVSFAAAIPVAWMSARPIEPALSQPAPGLKRGSVTSYSVTNLGPAFGNSIHLSLNNKGVVAGEGQFKPAVYRAAIWQQGKVRYLGTLRGQESFATAINDAGHVVGYTETPKNTGRALLYRGGRVIDLGDLGAGAEAHDINEPGQIVGTADVDGIGHAFLRSSRSLIDLNKRLGSVWSSAVAINDKGDIVGQVHTTDGLNLAYLYSRGKVTIVANFSGHNSFPTDLNNSGQITGLAERPQLPDIAFLYSAGKLTDFVGPPEYMTNVSAEAINNVGQVVGGARNRQGLSRAFVYAKGEMTDLNEVIPSDSAWVLVKALDINDRGQIVGRGLRNGESAAFLLTPDEQVKRK